MSRAMVAVPVDVLERAVRKMEIEYSHSVQLHHGRPPDNEHECWAEVEALRHYLVPAEALEKL